jgi:hypothetical protein
MDLLTNFNFSAQPNIVPIPFEPKSFKEWLLGIVVHDKRYRLVDDFYYYFVYEGKVYRVLIKAGFEYDGATVFRRLWGVLNITPDGKHRADTLFHDKGYIEKGLLDAEYWDMSVGKFQTTKLKLSKKFLDTLYRERIMQRGVPKITANIMFAGTRLLGVAFWPTFK